MLKTTKTIFTFVLLIISLNGISQKKADNKSASSDSLKNVPLSGLAFRSIGPAVTGGRVVAVAVNPFNHNEYYVAAGHGSLWKTEDNGITFTPVFDHEKSYSIGSVTLDPTNPNVVWVGTGEADNQSNVIYGDGIYKSEDGGKTWKNMGLRSSGHIGGIVVDPSDPNIVYAAAYGYLRKPGGDRGIFKTTDGGKTWKNVLFISQYTGCFELHMDPRYHNILYATAHQRMTKLFTAVRGGPESGIYRSTDSGENWEKMKTGLPTGDIGRIGLAISPVNPDIIYATIEAVKDKGIYKSTDRGVSWTKENSYISAYPFYFQKIFCDTKDVDRIYSMDVYMKVSIDGGKTWETLGENKKHPDNHVLWIDPDNNQHMIDGCDGGLYDTYNQGKTWEFKSNLPIAEVYKVTTDNATPFYNVYAGTQDNNSFFGPSKTIRSNGIVNSDWTFTASGDGFQTQVDWSDPDIVYSESQYGDLVRYNKKTGEALSIKPYDFNDTAYRFDWSTPLLISQFDHKRLFFGANKLFRTDDMGNLWKVISPDLTRGVPTQMLKLMDKSWSINDLASKGSMGQIATIAESPLDSNILFTGSGDGLIYFTDDGGETWTKSSTPGLPEYARIDQIIGSHFDKNVAYAACENFSDGDNSPYLYKTTDGGKSWFIFNGNLPDTGSVYTIAEDDVDKDLLFVGTQSGVFFTNDGGKEWIQLKDGIPTECVKSLVIQQREHDLVVSTFGRGIYILDNYTPLRYLSKETLEKEAYLFPVKDPEMYIQANPFAFRDQGFQGASYFTAPNPKPGAVFTFYMKKEIKSLKDQRIDSEKVEQKKGEDIKYPTYETQLKEQEEQKPYLLFTVTDEEGNVVRKIKEDPKKGVQRITWDFRYAPFTPVTFTPFDNSIPWNDPSLGYMVVPGKYKVSLSKFEDGKFTELSGPQEFTCKPLNNFSLSEKDEMALENFDKKVADLTRAISGADDYRKSLDDKLKYLEQAFIEGANVPEDVYDSVVSARKDLDAFNRLLNGDGLLSQYQGGVPTSVKRRVDIITSGLWVTTSAPTGTFTRLYDAAADQFGGLLADLKTIDNKVKTIEAELEKYGAPSTPDRFPSWKKE
jgi:photosystem II stability/assembly factor-like uncharacterized protein